MKLYASNLKENPSSLTYGIKFALRPDLTPEVRAKIARIALWGKERGRIDRLAARFHICRKTVYCFRNQLQSAVSKAYLADLPPKQSAISLRHETIRQILLLRLLARSPLGAISVILAANGHCRSSVGFISQVLTNLGDALPQVAAYTGEANWACDELFYLGSEPILVTVEPVSGAVLQVEAVRGSLKEAWKQHWQRLRAAGITPLLLVCDPGWMLRAARLEEEGLDYQPDSFHAVSHRLGIFLCRLEKAAHKAIESEYEREALCRNTQKPNQLPKFRAQWGEKREAGRQAIAQLEDFSFLYRCLLEQFNIFDRNGQLRQRAFAEAETRCALEMMRSLNLPKLDKELDDILKILPDLFAFLDKAAKTCQTMLESQLLEPHELPFWCAAWQWHKKSFKVKNNAPYRNQALNQCKQGLEWLQEDSQIPQQDFDDLQLTVFTLLDSIIQSSAAVEMFNSILRPFLNQARDQLSQQALNLIMDFYNHRRFTRGKRKGKAPIEILTGKDSDQDWLDRLLEVVKTNNI